MIGQVGLVMTAYLVGSIPFGLIVTRISKGVDVRRVGSGNIGATNVLRSAGKGAAALTLLCDFGKGFLPVILASHLGFGEGWAAATGLAAVLGHLYPLYVGFKGGKGVATSFGILLGLLPQVALSLMGLWLLMAVVTRYVSLAALTAAFAAPFLALTLDGRRWVFFLILFLALLIVFKHRGNIASLVRGTERRIGEWVTPGR